LKMGSPPEFSGGLFLIFFSKSIIDICFFSRVFLVAQIANIPS